MFHSINEQNTLTNLNTLTKHLKLTLHNTSNTSTPATSREASPLQMLRESCFHPLSPVLSQRWGKITEQVLPASIHYAHRTMTLEGSQDTQEWVLVSIEWLNTWVRSESHFFDSLGEHRWQSYMAACPAAAGGRCCVP